MQTPCYSALKLFMPVSARLNYYRRIFAAYIGGAQSQLTFWHDRPRINPNASALELGEYYMPFFEKADYRGHYDAAGIPMLHYHGRIGLQYNPIAVAQWGLGNYNLFCRTQNSDRQRKFLAASEWLCSHLEPNASGVGVWNHYFDWEYRTPLKAPWCSALAQGQGISLLVRAYLETGAVRYLDCATRALAAFHKSIGQGGVAFTDEHGDLWFEEYIVSPPTHILNGFIWAVWAVYDHLLATGDASSRALFDRGTRTLMNNLYHYDLGFWSLYEQSGTRLPMIASPFYHQLHIVQLRIMHQLTGEKIFAEYAERWDRYRRSRAKRTRALCYKSAFKLCYY